MKSINFFFGITLLGLGLRIFASFLPAFSIDMDVWFAWSERLISLGFSKFYNPQIWTHYTPGYLYILWMLGLIKHLFLIKNDLWFLLLFKFPNIIADLITSILIYKLIFSYSKKWARWGMVLYLFNPALIFNSTIWGQADSFLNLLLVLSVYFLMKNKKILFSGLFFSFAFLVKPQAIFLMPLIIILLIKKYNKYLAIEYLFIFILVSLVLALPFFPNDPFFGLIKLIIQMGKDYPQTTLNAFNFWQLFGNWQTDRSLIFGLTKQNLGLIIFFIIELIIALPLFLFKKNKQGLYYLTAALFLLSFFLFPTRIHERYLLPFFPFLLIASCLTKSLFLTVIYLVFSFIHFINLYFVFNSYYPAKIKIPLFFQINHMQNLPLIISFFSLILFATLLFYYEKKITSKIFGTWISLSNFLHKSLKNLLPRKEKKVEKKRIYLGLILLFAFLTRFINLGHPKAYVFDEVYHGFTAQEMAKGNKMAWEWWNTPPTGFAYEWTHPPLAKLFMAMGVSIFGQSQFAFRLPAVFFGVGVIYLTYLLGSMIFKNKKIGLLAAMLLSLDGMVLTMSRIGMADIDFLFFLLLTIYWVWQEKYFLSAFFLGCSIATKWTGIYLYPVVGLLLIKKLFEGVGKSKPLINYLLTKGIIFLIIPLFVYLSSYFGFFVSGHNLSQFRELQKQMWWYHTNLKATHNYQSKAFTWPIMFRPVWFWVDYKQDTMANIYNFGNPILWWSGLLVLPLAIYKAGEDSWKKKDWRLLIVIICYFIFWLPWSFSPRIMFLHHYQPALPFLCLLIGWGLWQIKNLKFKIKNWSINSFTLITIYCLLIALGFFWFYPINTGLPINKELLPYFFWFKSWK